jgi:hypothetical protein
MKVCCIRLTGQCASCNEVVLLALPPCESEVVESLDGIYRVGRGPLRACVHYDNTEIIAAVVGRQNEG